MRYRIQLIAFAILLALVMTPALSRAQDSGIKVEVSGFRNNNGLLRCSLWSGPDGFPRDDSHIWKHASGPVKNSSGKFKSNFVGYPLEGYGFSNNVNPQFKAPGFDECKFHYDGKGWKQFPVTMIYR